MRFGGRLLLCLVCLLAAGAAGGTALASGSPRFFPHPTRIRYDGECLTIDERDVFIVSGSFHYFRCPKELWRDRFRRIKEAGCNAVETYVPWNWHERARPSSPDDYSQVDLTDLRDWLRMAHKEFGLYTIVRPGPYICAEWDGGGFPRWLFPIGRAAGRIGLSPGLWLRSDDPVFLAWARHWMRAVSRVVAPEQITRKPPGQPGVILVQLENEYGICDQVSDAARLGQLRALAETVHSNGIDVPLFTCETGQCRDSDDPQLADVFDAVNLYPRMKIEASAARLNELQAAQPDAPPMVSELQGGWFSKVGGMLAEDQPGIGPAQLTAHALLAVQSGATILNWYMIFGGTNPGLWGSRDQTTTYDYDAPIREPGGVGEKYLAVAVVARMLRDHGHDLARSRPVVCQVESSSPDVDVAVLKDLAGETWVFFRNRSVSSPQRGTSVIWVGNTGVIRVDYDLKPFGSEVLRIGRGVTWPFDSGRSIPASRTRDGRRQADPAGVEWLPKPVPAPSRPARIPSAIRPAAALVREDPGAADWTEVGFGDFLPELGVFDARPTVYRTAVSLSAAEAAAADALRLSVLPGDKVAVRVNGRMAPVPDGRDAALGDRLHGGENVVEVLYNQAGQAKIGRALQDESGLRSAELGTKREDFESVKAVSGWRLGRELGGIAERWFEIPPGAGTAGWEVAKLDGAATVAARGSLADAPQGKATALATWYRVEFAMPALVPGEWVPWRAGIDAAGDGLIYLNGHALGRYWEAGPQRQFYLPECWLNFGRGKKNVITLCLSPMSKGVCIRAVEISPYADQAEFR